MVTINYITTSPLVCLSVYLGHISSQTLPLPGSDTPTSPLELSTNRSGDFTITEKAPNRAFSWLKVPTKNNLLIHYAKGKR